MYLIDESKRVGHHSTHDLGKDQTLRRQLHHASGLGESALPSSSSHIESGKLYPSAAALSSTSIYFASPAFESGLLLQSCSTAHLSRPLVY